MTDQHIVDGDLEVLAANTLAAGEDVSAIATTSILSTVSTAMPGSASASTATTTAAALDKDAQTIGTGLMDFSADVTSSISLIASNEDSVAQAFSSGEHAVSSPSRSSTTAKSPSPSLVARME